MIKYNQHMNIAILIHGIYYGSNILFRTFRLFKNIQHLEI